MVCTLIAMTKGSVLSLTVSFVSAYREGITAALDYNFRNAFTAWSVIHVV